MDPARPLHATEMIGFDRPHAEVIDPNTRQVWQSIELFPGEWEPLR